MKFLPVMSEMVLTRLSMSAFLRFSVTDWAAAALTVRSSSTASASLEDD